MSPVVFTIIVPTSGRTTLRRTLRALRRQDRGDIEVIVVSDGHQPVAEQIVRQLGWPSVRFIRGPNTRSWGNQQRMIGIAAARGRYLAFIDDDDVHRRRAFRHIRKVIREHPGRIVIFRMKRDGVVLWADQEVRWANVGTPMFLVPNVPGKVGTWVTEDRYSSDYDFISESVTLQGDPIWDPVVIVDAPPIPLRQRIRSKLAVRTRLRQLLASTQAR